MDETTTRELLEAVRNGDGSAEQELAELVYNELKKVASRHLRRERSSHTLQTTALVNEAYLRLLGGSTIDWKDRGHFFATAAQAMRRVLVDHARARRAEKRGGDAIHVSYSGFEASLGPRTEEVLAVDQALERLGRVSPRQKLVVEMRFFAGFTEEEIAAFLDLTPRTVKRDWAVARAFLMQSIKGKDQASAS